MAPSPLRIMVVHDQPATVWSLSKFLKSAGYTVTQFTDGHRALDALDAAAANMVLAGWDMAPLGGVEFAGQLRSRGDWEHIHLFLLVDDPQPDDLIEALRAGADDFLRLPLVHGELLSRLRSAARTLEFERRLRAQARRDALTGLPSLFAFRQELEEHSAFPGRRRHPPCLLLADLDMFARVNHVYGWPAADQVLAAVARHLQDFAGDELRWHRVAGNRFAIILPNASPDEAAHWAARCRGALAEFSADVAGAQVTLTASFALAPIHTGSGAAEALQRAEAALMAAKQSGRDKVIAADGIESVTGDRGGMGSAVDPLRSALARDVMTSGVVSFSRQESIQAAAEFMRESRLATVPVVDADGMLVGTVSEANLTARLLADPLTSKSVDEVLNADAPQFDENTTVQTLYEFFQRNNMNRIEILSSGRPTGYITRGALAALGESLHADTFATESPPTHSSAYLLVPDLAWADD